MKKGFTLIELLAVIVILAIIAVIAVPIVLNIIDETKSNATLRSADFYLDAVEYSISDAYLYHGGLTDGDYPITQDGNLCKTALSCSEENKLKVEVNGETPTRGTITIANGNISAIDLKYGEKTIVKNSQGKLVYQVIEAGKFDSVCKAAKEQKFATNPYDEGYKYECIVDPNKPEYTFYVLSYNDENGEVTLNKEDAKSINLIMAQNINSDGTPVTKAISESEKSSNGGIYNIVEWINQEDYELSEGKSWGQSVDENRFGPITAMNFLDEATKNWTNAKVIILNTFTDDKGTKYSMKEYNTYARMPD